MKRLILFICIVFFGLTVSSFKIPFNSKAESFKNIVLFYIENSKGTDNNSLSTLTLEKLKTEVKKNITKKTKLKYKKKIKNITKKIKLNYLKNRKKF